MDVELASVVTAVSKNKSIKHLHMGRNLTNMKAKHISCVMESVVQLVQEEDCVLQSLMLPDSRLKSDLYNLINALGSNQCLQTIDIRFVYACFPGSNFFPLFLILLLNSEVILFFVSFNGVKERGKNYFYLQKKNFFHCKICLF